MDTRTGEIHEMLEGETLPQFARRLGGQPKDFVPVAHRPVGQCPKCHGTGAVKRGLFSRRFKPCECVL